MAAMQQIVYLILLMHFKLLVAHVDALIANFPSLFSVGFNSHSQFTLSQRMS